MKTYLTKPGNGSNKDNMKGDNMKKKIVLILCVLFLAVGCASTSNVGLTPEQIEQRQDEAQKQRASFFAEVTEALFSSLGGN